MNLTGYFAIKHRTALLVLTQPQLRLLEKLDDMGVEVSEFDELVLIENPVSGHRAYVTPFEAALVNWVYDTYSTYGFGGMTYNGRKVAIGTFDRVKMLILNINPSVYRNFID